MTNPIKATKKVIDTSYCATLVKMFQQRASFIISSLESGNFSFLFVPVLLCENVRVE